MKAMTMTLSVLTLALLLTNPVHASDMDRIAVAADGKTTAAQVSAVAARSPYFLIVDATGTLLEAVDNPYHDAAKRAGSAVVPFLAQRSVTVVVAGEFGKNMVQAMKAGGIAYVTFRGSVDAAIKKVLEAGIQPPQ